MVAVGLAMVAVGLAVVAASQLVAVQFATTHNTGLPFEKSRMDCNNLYDVDGVADFWSWLGSGIAPKVWLSPIVWGLNESQANIDTLHTRPPMLSMCGTGHQMMSPWNFLGGRPATVTS